MSVFKSACAAMFPGMEQEYRFIHNRQWRFDMAWPKYKIACEIEGGIWVRGRHTRGKGYESDCEKYSTAAIDGWVVVRVTPGMISSGKALQFLEAAFSTSRQAMVSRNTAVAAQLKASGVKSGVPDLFLPLPIPGRSAGLWIEMKAPCGTITQNQDDYLRFLSEVGFLTKVCYSAQDAIDEIRGYLERCRSVMVVGDPVLE